MRETLAVITNNNTAVAKTEQYHSTTVMFMPPKLGSDNKGMVYIAKSHLNLAHEGVMQNFLFTLVLMGGGGVK